MTFPDKVMPNGKIHVVPLNCPVERVSYYRYKLLPSNDL